MSDLRRDTSTRPENPFPRIPEVAAGQGAQPEVTIATRAVQMAREFVDDHVRTGAGGRSLAIVGDYGTGKSHLASEVIRKLHEADPGAVICVVRARSDETVHNIYQRIFDQYQARTDNCTIAIGLHRTDIRRRITTIFAEIERERRANVEASESFATVNTPAAAVLTRPDGSTLASDLGEDIELTRALQDRLCDITEDRELGDGLSLLMHNDSEIADNAWNWLRGGPVTSDIAKRGVAEPIENDPRALAALHALSLLFNRTGTRFALAIDDIERIGGRNGNAYHIVDATLNPLLRWTADSRSLLIISGLAAAWQELPDGVRQRVSKVISQDSFSRDQITSYQREAYAKSKITNPKFTSGAFDRLLDISAGSPRKVVDICYNAYQEVPDGRSITGPVIERASLMSGAFSLENIAARIRDFCVRLGHQVVPEHPIGDAIAPLWVAAGSGDAGCAIVVSESIVNTAAANRVARLGDALKGPSSRMVLLVFAGQLAQSQRTKVDHAFTQVLRWDQDGFLDEMRAVLGKLGSQADSEILHQLRDDVHSLQSFQADDHESLAKLAEAQDEQRVRAMIREETRRAYLRSPASSDVPVFGEGYEELQRVYDGAVSMIREALGNAGRHWMSIFEPHDPEKGIDRARAPGDRAPLPADLTQMPILQTMGVLSSLDCSLDGFGLAVCGVLALDPKRKAARRQWLGYQCDQFDQSVEDMIRAIPTSHEDPDRIVLRVLGVDRAGISAKLKGLGGIAFDTVFPVGFNRH